MIVRNDKPLWRLELELDRQDVQTRQRTVRAALVELLAYLAALAVVLAAAAAIW